MMDREITGQPGIAFGETVHRYDLRYSLFGRWFVQSIFIGLGVPGTIGLLINGENLLPLGVWTAFGFAMWLITRPIMWARSYAILHPAWIDICDSSRHIGKHHIPFSTIHEIVADESSGFLGVEYHAQGGLSLLDKFSRGPTGVSIYLRDPLDADRLRDAIQRGRNRQQLGTQD